MSTDYQALIWISILAACLLYRVVFNINMTETKRTVILGAVSLFLIVYCSEIMAMPKWHVFIYTMSFAMLCAVYDGAYAGGLNHYVKGYMLKFSYLAQIGIWSGLIAWSTRWLF